VGAWRRMFMQMPYLRDALITLGMVVETFETAISWDRFERFYQEVLSATRRAAIEVCGQALITCRLTHVYPDGAAPYFTVLGPSRAGAGVGSGMRSRRRRARRSWPPGGRSPTTTRWGAIIDPAMIASGRICSRARLSASSARSIRRGS